VAVLSEPALRDLVFLREDVSCRLPCWNGLTPGVSNPIDIANFFARLGIDPVGLTPIDIRLIPDSPWSRSVGTELEYGSTIGTTAIRVGLDSVSVDWSPFDGSVQAIRISLWRPEGFDIRSLLSSLGRPDAVLMDHAGVGRYRTVLPYASKGALSGWMQLLKTGHAFA
jgi:hypothetical protein